MSVKCPRLPKSPAPHDLRRRRLTMVALTVAGIIGGVLLFLHDPSRQRMMGSIPFPHCLFHDLTGLQCPGCGGTRAMHALLHGHIETALRYNPLTVLVLPFLLAAYILAIARLFLPRAPSPIWISARYIRLLALAVVLFWVLRNLPLYPFTLLAPPPS